VFGSLQFQTTTKNEIGNPFGEVYLIFFILGYFATAPFGGELGTRTPDFLRVMHLLNQGENFIIP